MIVEQFLTWMHTAPLDGRRRATAALARTYLFAEIDDADREQIEATLTVLLDDPEPEIAFAIAEVLGPSRDAPRHLILALAESAPEVAAIVLQQSPVLIEAELVDFLAEGSEAAQVAIASRPWLSPGVSAAVAEIGELDACIMLACNLTAAIPEASLMILANRFGCDEDLREAMLSRAHLPLPVRHTLLMRASLANAGPSSERGRTRQERVASAVTESKDKTTVQMAAAASTEELPEFVDHLRTTGQLTTTLLLRAVTLGDVRFLQEALTQLSGLPRRRVEGLIIEGRESACRALLAKAGLPQRTFPAFIAALDVQRELAGETGLRTPMEADDHRFASRVVERVLTRYRAAGAANEDDLIVLLRRFATEAARDAARALIAEIAQRPPLLLGPPDHDVEDIELQSDDDAELETAEWADDLRADDDPYIDVEVDEIYEVLPQARAA